MAADGKVKDRKKKKMETEKVNDDSILKMEDISNEKKKRKAADNETSLINDCAETTERKKWKKKNKTDDNENTMIDGKGITKKKKRKTEDVDNSNPEDQSNVDLLCEETSKKKKKRHNEDIDNLESTNNVHKTDEKQGWKKIKATSIDKEMKFRKVDSSNSIDSSGAKTKEQSSLSLKKMKKRLRFMEDKAIKELLEQRANVGSEMQVKRIKSVHGEVSYDEMMDELIQKLKKKTAKRAKLQRDKKIRKIEKLDEKMKMLKKEAVEKAVELNSDALNKLKSIHEAIVRKIKKKGRTKRFAINGMAEERSKIGRDNLAATCQAGTAIVQQRSSDARARVKQAVRETKTALESDLKLFKQRVEELDKNCLALDPAFSGAVSVKGYIYVHTKTTFYRQ